VVRHVDVGLGEVTTAQPISELTLIALAVIGLLGIIIPAWYAKQSREHAQMASIQATQANDAVNHRHPDSPRLFDMVVEHKADMDDLSDQVAELERVNSSEHIEIVKVLTDHIDDAAPKLAALVEHINKEKP